MKLLHLFGGLGQKPQLLNPDLLNVHLPQNKSVYRPLSELFEAGRKAMPENAVFTFAIYPRDERAALRISCSVPTEKGFDEIWEAAVDPYTAQVTGKRLMSASDNPFPKTLIGFVFELHYALFLGETVGYAVVAIIAALLIISLLTGLILWWPLTGKWRQVLTIKRGSSAERFNFDLHKTIGFYFVLVLIPVLFAGIYMNRPENVVPLVELFSPATYAYWFQSSPKVDVEPINLSQAVDNANHRYPKGRPHWIFGAPGTTDTYTVCKNDVDRPGSWLQRVCLVMDRYTGEFLDIDDPADAAAGEIFTHWQWSLHSGQAFGMVGRLLVCITGLVCPLLFITGVIRWLQKRRARLRKNRSVVSTPIKKVN